MLIAVDAVFVQTEPRPPATSGAWQGDSDLPTGTAPLMKQVGSSARAVEAGQAVCAGEAAGAWLQLAAPRRGSRGTHPRPYGALFSAGSV